MKDSNLIYLLVFVLLSCSTKAFGQDFMKDMERINSVFQQGQACELEYKLFRRGVTNPVEIINGDYLTLEDKYILNLHDVRVISIAEERLLINESEKFLALAKPSVFEDYGQIDFSRMAPFIDTIRPIKDLPDGIIGYGIFLKSYLSNPYKRIEVYMNQETGHPTKIRLLYTNEIDFSNDNSVILGFPVIEIRYKNIRAQKVDYKEFDTKRYYYCDTKGMCAGVGKYAEYEIYNQKDL